MNTLDNDVVDFDILRDLRLESIDLIDALKRVPTSLIIFKNSRDSDREECDTFEKNMREDSFYSVIFKSLDQKTADNNISNGAAEALIVLTLLRILMIRELRSLLDDLPQDLVFYSFAELKKLLFNKIEECEIRKVQIEIILKESRRRVENVA